MFGLDAKRKLYIDVLLNGTQKVRQELGLVEAAGTRAATAGIGGWGKAAGAIGLVATAVAGLERAYGPMVAEAAEAEHIHAQLEQTLLSTGRAATLSADQLDEYTDALTRKTTIEDDSITRVQQLLLTYKQIGDEIFPKVTETILDMAVVLDGKANPSLGKLESVTKQVGKALSDPIKGMTQLAKQHVVLDASTKKQISALIHGNQLYEAQILLLAELIERYGGSASELDTYTESAIQYKKAWGEVREELGALRTESPLHRAVLDNLADSLFGIAEALEAIRDSKINWADILGIGVMRSVGMSFQASPIPGLGPLGAWLVNTADDATLLMVGDGKDKKAAPRSGGGGGGGRRSRGGGSGAKAFDEAAWNAENLDGWGYAKSLVSDAVRNSNLVIGPGFVYVDQSDQLGQHFESDLAKLALVRAAGGGVLPGGADIASIISKDNFSARLGVINGGNGMYYGLGRDGKTFGWQRGDRGLQGGNFGVPADNTDWSNWSTSSNYDFVEGGWFGAAEYAQMMATRNRRSIGHKNNRLGYAQSILDGDLAGLGGMFGGVYGAGWGAVGQVGGGLLKDIGKGLGDLLGFGGGGKQPEVVAGKLQTYDEQVHHALEAGLSELLSVTRGLQSRGMGAGVDSAMAHIKMQRTRAGASRLSLGGLR